MTNSIIIVRRLFSCNNNDMINANIYSTKQTKTKKYVRYIINKTDLCIIRCAQ